MTDGSNGARTRVTRWLGRGSVALVVLVAVAVGLELGAPAAVLWIAFVALVSAVLLFWEGLRLALDPAVEERDVDGVAVAGVGGDLEDRKRAALRALRDIEFERSIRRLSEDDYAELRERYRAEARDALRAIDEATQATLGSDLAKAERLVARALGETAHVREQAGEEPAAPAPTGKKRKRAGAAKRARDEAAPVEEPATVEREHDAAQKRCPAESCGADNDLDAVFCKKCGTRMETGS